MNYKQILKNAYEKYVKHWCELRGYNPADVDPETGINGECYVCINEFEQNEFRDDEYMSQILTDNEFTLWQNRNELKEILLKSLITRIYFKQKNGELRECPRCGRILDPKLSLNAFSRRADVYICAPCGTLEAMEDAPCPPFDKVPKMPLENWEFALNISFDS